MCRGSGDRRSLLEEQHQYQRAGGEGEADQATGQTWPGAVLQPPGNQDAEWREDKAEDQDFHAVDTSMDIASDGSDFGGQSPS